MNWIHVLQHWLAVHTGIVNEPGPYYGFWSGFGSDIGEVTIIGGLYMVYKKHNCHEPGCWRIGKYPVDGTPFMSCHKHHPEMDGKPTKGHMAHAYNMARISNAKRSKTGN